MTDHNPHLESSQALWGKQKTPRSYLIQKSPVIADIWIGPLIICLDFQNTIKKQNEISSENKDF